MLLRSGSGPTQTVLVASRAMMVTAGNADARARSAIASIEIPPGHTKARHREKAVLDAETHVAPVPGGGSGKKTVGPPR